MRDNENYFSSIHLPLKAGGRRASALGGGSTTPTGMQSSIKSFFGKEVSLKLLECEGVCAWGGGG